MKMERRNSSALARTKSEQLVKSVVTALKSRTSSESLVATEGGGGSTPTSKSSRPMMAASPGRSGGRNTHIRKSRSAQMKFDLDEVSSGAALSHSSSASLGLSFSLIGSTLPHDEIADSKPIADEDIRDVQE